MNKIYNNLTVENLIKTETFKKLTIKQKEEILNANIPEYLKSNTKISEKQKYLYPHNYKGGYIKQEYLPKDMKDKIYYNDKWGNDERNYKK